MKAADRCPSRWRQMPSEPVIQCARKAGHKGLHFNTAAHRQWEIGSEDPCDAVWDWAYSNGRSRCVLKGSHSYHASAGKVVEWQNWQWKPGQS